MVAVVSAVASYPATGVTGPMGADFTPSALLRRQVPKPAAAPESPLRVSFTGRLAHGARAVVEAATGQAGLCVELEQGAGRPNVLATLWLGDGYEAQRDCDARAEALRAGQLVTVRGEGLRMRFHAGDMAVAVSIVTGIDAVHAP